MKLAGDIAFIPLFKASLPEVWLGYILCARLLAAFGRRENKTPKKVLSRAREMVFLDYVGIQNRKIRGQGWKDKKDFIYS